MFKRGSGCTDAREMGFEDNDRLFRQRGLIVDRLAELDADDPEARLLRRRLEDVTTELLESNRGLAMEWAKKFRRDGRVDDYEAAAMAGLFEAITSYDVDGEASFSHWARFPIRSACIATLRDTELAHLSRNDVDSRPAVLKALAAGADVEAAADAAGATTAQVERIRDHSAPSSLDAPLGDDGGATRGDLVAALPDTDVDMSDAILAATAVLTARELFVFQAAGYLGGAPQTLAEIGAEIGVSREAVRKTLDRAVEKVTAELDAQSSSRA